MSGRDRVGTAEGHQARRIADHHALECSRCADRTITQVGVNVDRARSAAQFQIVVLGGLRVHRGIVRQRDVARRVLSRVETAVAVGRDQQVAVNRDASVQAHIAAARGSQFQQTIAIPGSDGVVVVIAATVEHDAARDHVVVIRVANASTQVDRAHTANQGQRSQVLSAVLIGVIGSTERDSSRGVLDR